MGFWVHRAERADRLVDGLAAMLRDPLADPFAFELVLVPAKGVERWLSQRLSHQLGTAPGGEDGVCAGVEFRSPHSLTAELLGTRDEDPWRPETLMWPLLRVIDASMGEPWAAVLADHLGQGMEGEEGRLRRGRRLAVARRLAGLLATYSVQRPEMMSDWESGGSSLGGPVGPGGSRRPLPEDLVWQPELWRRVVAQVGQTARLGSGPISPVRRHAQAVAQLRAGSLELALPERLSLFGHTRISPTEAELLAALGAHRDVHLWITHPSPALWEAGLAGRAEMGDDPGWRRESWRITDPTDRDGHPLLASMARDIRETEDVLLRAGALDAAAVDVASGGDVAAPPTRSGTVLSRIQSDLAADRRPTPWSEGLDGSVEVHACHGPARQVEVLREVLLAKLEDDPTLASRDIVIMCPDIDAYAPLINGVFGLGEAVAGGHPGQQLPIMLADRSPTQTNPLLGVLGRILELADGRAEASRVVDLFAADAIRRRFGFTESDLETLTGWITASGVRWGWDAQGRTRFGLDAFAQNTWQFGVDRVLAGVALSDDSGLWLGPTLPMDDVSTSDISLAGRYAEAIDRLHRFTERLRGEHPVEEWLDLLREGVESLTDVPAGEEWQLAQVHRELAGFGAAASSEGAEGGPLELGLDDIKAMLRGRLAGRPTRANFRTGAVTVCTMTPMRSVPHRVICLLGLDDGVFPRGGSIDGDDVLAREQRVGEPDLRSQDRQLFLDAVMAATESLVITYTGFNESTGAIRPPSVPLREFLDVLETTAGTAEVVRSHHSQAFHPDYLTGPSPFSFDPSAAAAARSAAGVRAGAQALVDLRLPPSPPEEIELADLIEMVTSPIRGFLRQRLAVEIPREADEISDRIPIDPVGLDSWQVGERMLRQVLRGVSPDEALQREWRQGAMPPGKYGWQQTKSLLGSLRPLVDRFQDSVGDRVPTAHDIDLDLGGGRRLVGVVPGVYDDRLVRVTFSRLRAKQRLEAWISLLALTASEDRPWVARSIGRGVRPYRGADTPVLGMAEYRTPEEAGTVLRELVELHDRALTRCLPLVPDAGRTFAQLAPRYRDWGNWKLVNDVRESFRDDVRAPEVALAWGRQPTLADFLESGDPGNRSGGQHLFGTEAVRVWAPALAAEVS